MTGIMIFSILFLLFLLYLGVIGTQVLRALDQGGGGISGAASCSFVQITPVSCVYTKKVDGTFDLIVKGAHSGTSIPVKEINVLLTYSSTKDVVRKSATSIPKLFETSGVYFENKLSTKKYSGVSLAHSIFLENGKNNVACNPSEEVECLEN